MSKKHFEAMAAIIRNSSHSKEEKMIAALLFCDLCNQFAPNFDMNKFLRACGL